jgi:hypothetical protein
MLFKEKNRCLFWEMYETLCGQNAQFSNVATDGTYTNHWALKLRSNNKGKTNISAGNA